MNKQSKKKPRASKVKKPKAVKAWAICNRGRLWLNDIYKKEGSAKRARAYGVAIARLASNSTVIPVRIVPL